LAVDLRDPLDFAFDFGGAQSGVLPPCSRRMALRKVYLVLVYMDLYCEKLSESFLRL
jgi:hypothetical protein